MAWTYVLFQGLRSPVKVNSYGTYFAMSATVQLDSSRLEVCRFIIHESLTTV
jgi:hypothetical protein